MSPSSLAGDVQVKCCCSVVKSFLTLCDLKDCSTPVFAVLHYVLAFAQIDSCLLNSPGKNIRVVCHSLLQGIFLTQKSNPSILHCRQILYDLSHQESPFPQCHRDHSVAAIQGKSKSSFQEDQNCTSLGSPHIRNLNTKREMLSHSEWKTFPSQNSIICQTIHQERG